MASKTEPLVACVCLTADRQALTERAVRCFKDQTYRNKALLIFDTGEVKFKYRTFIGDDHIDHWLGKGGRTIGALRNHANSQVQADIIAHFDSDDVSLPNRLEEQVKLLLETEAAEDEAERNRILPGKPYPGKPYPAFAGVAYRKVPFWNRRRTTVRVDGGEREVTAEPGAWMFNSTFPFPGATFMYRRSLWERQPFPDRNTGEDTWWDGRTFLRAHPGVAPMLCEIHGGNTSSHVRPDLPEWTRHPELDAQYRKILEET